jgi:hypothetical protein
VKKTFSFSEKSKQTFILIFYKPVTKPCWNIRGKYNHRHLNIKIEFRYSNIKGGVVKVEINEVDTKIELKVDIFLLG